MTFCDELVWQEIKRDIFPRRGILNEAPLDDEDEKEV